MLKLFLDLFRPAYGVTLVAIPIASMIDHLGREATPWGAVAALPIWVWSAAFFALPFIVPAAGLAMLIQRLGGDRWRSGIGRVLFAMLCAGLGAAIVTSTIHSLGLIAAAAGGTAAWVAASPDWPPHWCTGLVVGAGLIAGAILGWQLY